MGKPAALNSARGKASNHPMLTALLQAFGTSILAAVLLARPESDSDAKRFH
jgi:hypothetical protein